MLKINIYEIMCSLTHVILSGEFDNVKYMPNLASNFTSCQSLALLLSLSHSKNSKLDKYDC